MPSFLTSQEKPKPKAKPKCPNKKKCCQCKDVGCNTCEPPNFEYPPVCKCCGQLTLPEFSSVWSSPDVFPSQLNPAPMNPLSPIVADPSLQRLRPAGLPSKKHPPFDPCTGRELWNPNQNQLAPRLPGPQSIPASFPMPGMNNPFAPNIQFGSDPQLFLGRGSCPPCPSYQQMQSTPKKTSSGISLGKSKGKNKSSSTNALGKAKNKVRKTSSYTQDKGVDKVLWQRGNKRSASAGPKQNDCCNCCISSSKGSNTAKKTTSDYPATRKVPPPKK